MTAKGTEEGEEEVERRRRGRRKRKEKEKRKEREIGGWGRAGSPLPRGDPI